MQSNRNTHVTQQMAIELLAKPCREAGVHRDDFKKYFSSDKVQRMIREMTRFLPQETSHLKLIDSVTLNACEAGPGISPENKGPFTYVDSDFDRLGAHTVSKPTDAVQAYVYEQTKDGTYAEIYGSFDTDLDLLQFETEEQIKEFVKSHRHLLHPKGWATHFMFRNKAGKRFVAYVSWDAGGDLGVYVSRFSYSSEWYASSAYRFVVLATRSLRTQN